MGFKLIQFVQNRSKQINYEKVMKIIVFIIAIAAIRFAYTNWGTPLNVDKAIQQGTFNIKTEKSIDKVIHGRENTAKDNQEALDKN